MFQNHDYTKPSKPKKVHGQHHQIDNEQDERYEAAMSLGDIDTAPLRIVSLGYANTGASSLMLKMAYNVFSDDPDENKLLQWDHAQMQYRYHNDNIRISISDLKGFDNTITKDEMNDYISGVAQYSNVILLTYSITSKESFQGNYSIQDIKKCLDKNLIQLNEQKIVLLIGIKKDLKKEREISTKQGQDLAHKWEIPFYEISNKNGENIKNILNQICNIYTKNTFNYPVISIKEDIGDTPTTDDTEEQDPDDSQRVVLVKHSSHSVSGSDDDNDDQPLVVSNRKSGKFSAPWCCCGWLAKCCGFGNQQKKK